MPPKIKGESITDMNDCRFITVYVNRKISKKNKQNFASFFVKFKFVVKKTDTDEMVKKMVMDEFKEQYSPIVKDGDPLPEEFEVTQILNQTPKEFGMQSQEWWS